MGLQTYTVSFSTNNGASWTALTNVQNIQFSIGRQAQLEQIKASTGSFEMRYPTGYASPITGLVSGTGVQIENTTGAPYTIFTGRISDVTTQWGIPFAGGVGQEDYLQATFEGAFSAAGRLEGNGYVMPAGRIMDQANTATIETGMTIGYSSTFTTLAGTTVSGTWGDWIARVCQSTNSRIQDSILLDFVDIRDPFNFGTTPIGFSDVANDATNQVYNQINFDSLADNFYTQVTVTPESFPAATVTKTGAASPFRTYQTNTLNNSTSQAKDYADFLLGTYGEPRFAISSFSCMAEAQSSFQLDKVGDFALLARAPGTQVAVTFRGTTYQCLIEGVTMSATPAGAMFTYYVSGADLNAFLRLDNTVFGVLDANRLGY